MDNKEQRKVRDVLPDEMITLAVHIRPCAPKEGVEHVLKALSEQVQMILSGVDAVFKIGTDGNCVAICTVEAHMPTEEENLIWSKLPAGDEA